MWAGLSAISAVVKDNIWLDKFAYLMYPNIYVMLHADSGLRKGPPVAMAKKLVTAVNNTRIISGRSSIQGILKELGTGQSQPGGKGAVFTSTAFICSSELTSSIVEDKAATDILTDLYDRNYNIGNWKSLLKMESFSLKDPTISMLTATNEAHSQEFFQRKEIKGGFLARTFVIYENERQSVNSLMFAPEHKTDYKILSDYLKELAKLKGAVTIDDESRHYFDRWYRSLISEISTNNIKDSTGTLNRFDESVLKVALLISLANEPVLHITKLAIEESIEHCEKLIGNMRRTTMGGNSEHRWVQHKTIMMKELIDREPHIMTRMQFNKKYWALANSKEWDEIAVSLQDSGFISLSQQGQNIIYEMSEEMAIKFREQFKGKN